MKYRPPAFLSSQGSSFTRLVCLPPGDIAQWLTTLSCFKTCQKETQTLEQRRVKIAFLIHINLHLGISFHFFP